MLLFQVPAELSNTVAALGLLDLPATVSKAAQSAPLVLCQAIITLSSVCHLTLLRGFI